MAFAFLIVGLFLISSARAQGPENTLVVVNADSPDSLAIANRYVQLRNIPAVNVVYLRNITISKKLGFESSGTKAFQREILNPILKAMKDRGIENQIDCITYSSGFPTRINFLPEMKKYLKNTGKKYNIQLHAPWASITSLTYFHKNVYSDRPDFLELNANRYAKATSTKILQNPFAGDQADLYAKAERALAEKDYSAAAQILFKLGKRHPNQVSVAYALARVLAFKGDDKKAIELLSYARSIGFAHRSLVAKDPAFAGLQSDKAFQSVLSEIEDLPERVLPTRGFSGRSYWSKNGWACSSADQGERYVLSTVLALTGKGQSTLEQALNQLQTSVGADQTAPRGNVYFAKHKDIRSKTRQSQFRFAAAELESMGRIAKISDSKCPPNDKNVIGATLGSPQINWKKSESRFLPGALCDNFTSAGAYWDEPTQTKLTAFLNAGAAGACGTVYEPYTIAPKVPNARLHAHYARGCTLAESFYQSVSGPFQLLIVGDPLCCPFGDFPKFEVEGLESGEIVKNDFELAIQTADNSPALRSYELFFDGVFLTTINNPDRFRVSIDDMSNGDHEIRIVGIADSLAANRSTQLTEFTIDRSGHRVSLEPESHPVETGENNSLVRGLPLDIEISPWH